MGNVNGSALAALAAAVSEDLLDEFAPTSGGSEPDRMLTPPPVSGEAYPVWLGSEERANYLRGGVTFNTAYSDNVLGATGTSPVSDLSYSVWPTISLDETTTRLHAALTYSPGFTFYQRTSAYTKRTKTCRWTCNTGSARM